jgi:hypothetical protein
MFKITDIFDKFFYAAVCSVISVNLLLKAATHFESLLYLFYFLAVFVYGYFSMIMLKYLHNHGSHILVLLIRFSIILIPIEDLAKFTLEHFIF